MSAESVFADMVETLPSELEVDIAKALLKLRFSEAQHERMHELLDKNNSGEMTAAERKEMEDFLHVGQFVDLLQAKSRLTLKRAKEAKS